MRTCFFFFFSEAHPRCANAAARDRSFYRLKSLKTTCRARDKTQKLSRQWIINRTVNRKCFRVYGIYAYFLKYGKVEIVKPVSPKILTIKENSCILKPCLSRFSRKSLKSSSFIYMSMYKFAYYLNRKSLFLEIPLRTDGGLSSFSPSFSQPF